MKLEHKNENEAPTFFLPILFSLVCLLLILLTSLISHELFLLSEGTSLVAFDAGIYVATGAWLGFYSVIVVYIAAVLSSILILNVPLELALINNLLIPLESIGIMFLIRTNLVESSLDEIEDWVLFAAVQFLVVVPAALFYVEATAYFGYWPHVWETLGFDLLLRIIISHLSGGILFGGLLIMWFTGTLKEKGLYIEHFFT